MTGKIFLGHVLVTLKGECEPIVIVSSESEYQIADLGVISSNQFHGEYL